MLAEAVAEDVSAASATLEIGTFYKSTEQLPTKSAEAAASKRRRLARCETDELCHKAIRDNFKHWSHAACFETRNEEGLTLFEKLKRDKHARRHDAHCSIRFGPAYYQSLRYEFSDLDAPVHNLKVKDLEEET
eukprot:6490686-Amphidinium_carterae.2